MKNLICLLPVAGAEVISVGVIDRHLVSCLLIMSDKEGVEDEMLSTKRC